MLENRAAVRSREIGTKENVKVRAYSFRESPDSIVMNYLAKEKPKVAGTGLPNLPFTKVIGNQ